MKHHLILNNKTLCGRNVTKKMKSPIDGYKGYKVPCKLCKKARVVKKIALRMAEARVLKEWKTKMYGILHKE